MRALVPERLNTARMMAERLGEDHLYELEDLLLDPRVQRWLWPFAEPQTQPDVADSLAFAIAHWERHGFGPWLLRDAGGRGEAVGRGGLLRGEVDGAPVTEVIWMIDPAHWGRGLATELALASVEIAFARLEVEEVVALTLPENMASRRVMEKAGLSYSRSTVHAGLEHVLYVRRHPVLGGG